ncbi:MAG: chemotaxis protein CheW [Spirochaetales bacterium]|nr:chemotaxis protein CheW [Spirochaetales bacterium]
MDDEIWKVFSSETMEMADSLEESILRYEKDGETAALKQAYHQTHSIKGSLGIIEFNTLENMVHRCEDLFQSCMEKAFTRKKLFVRVVLEMVDLVRQVIHRESEAVLDRKTIAAFNELLANDFYSSEGDPLNNTSVQQDTVNEKKTLRVESAKLDELLNLTGELLTAGDSFKELSEELRDNRLSSRTSILLGLIDQLSNRTLEMRMIPLAPVMKRFKRTVRDLAEETGKQIRLELEGEQTEVDKTIAERISDPLTHLLRNCVDHGIASPGEREKAGKNPEGVIRLGARQENDAIFISISDDGNGIDYDRIRAKASNNPEWQHINNPEELAALIFEPGFSTAGEVSTLSGRGMGMSAVRDAVQSLRGSLAIESEPGRGTSFSMRFPLSLALVEGLLIQMEDNYYIIPSEDVIECIDIHPDSIDQSLDITSMEWNGSVLPLINLKRIMRMEGVSGNIVVVRNQNSSCGVVCDKVVSILQTVVKPLHPLLKREAWMQGSSVLGSGEPVLIINISGLINQFRD